MKIILWLSSPHNFKIKDYSINVVFFQTGCGKIPAAASTQFVIDKWSPRLIINLGTCGRFVGKVERGDIIIVARMVVYDIYERSGNFDEQIEKYITKLDLFWLEKPYPMNARLVVVGSGDQDLDPAKTPYLIEKYGVVAADWESGAIAYVAFKNKKIKCLIIRGISDVVDSNGKPSSEKEIVKGTLTIMKKLIDGLSDWISKAGLIYES